MYPQLRRSPQSKINAILIDFPNISLNTWFDGKRFPNQHRVHSETAQRKEKPLYLRLPIFAGLTFREVANTNVNCWVWLRVANTGASSIAGFVKNVPALAWEL